MRERDLVSRFPTLFHVADPTSWDSIAEHGLLSTSALLDLYGINGARRDEIEAWPRRREFRLDGYSLPTVLIRDQVPLLPLRDAHLLDGLTVSDWCRRHQHGLCPATAGAPWPEDFPADRSVFESGRGVHRGVGNPGFR